MYVLLSNIKYILLRKIDKIITIAKKKIVASLIRFAPLVLREMVAEPIPPQPIKKDNKVNLQNAR